MKNEDFDRLKKLCDENGFKVYQTSWANGPVVTLAPKDIWEGVEFAKELTGGGIVKITPEMGFIKDSEGTYIFKKLYKSSTEQAYKEQLKAKAFELFGEIKEGDRFDRLGFPICDAILPQIIVMDGLGGTQAFVYFKSDDSLEFNGYIIYQNGQWAKKLPKRIKVGLDYKSTIDGINNTGDWCQCTFIFDKIIGTEKAKELGVIIEKYLNGEIETP